MPLALPAAEVLIRNHVRVSGHPDGRPLVFVHGFACDQRMWEQIASRVEASYRVVTPDLVGAGQSDVTACDILRHGRVDGYAADRVEVAEALDLRDAVATGHSFGATLGILAHTAAPERFTGLVLIGPSARYVDDPADGYVGGLSEADVEGLLEIIETNFHGWATAMAPTIMGNPDRPELARELADIDHATHPEIAARWARVTFGADVRSLLPEVAAPAVVLQSTDDPIVPAGSRLPVIGMTANAMKGDRERSLDAGMDDYVSNSLRVEELDQLLARRLPARATTCRSTTTACARCAKYGDLLEQLIDIFAETTPEALA